MVLRRGFRVLAKLGEARGGEEGLEMRSGSQRLRGKSEGRGEFMEKGKRSNAKAL